jgi:micrococcal nuclease
MRRLFVPLLAVIVLGCNGADERAQEQGPPSSRHSIPNGRVATIERIVDGDTIVVVEDETVRLIGIDTPETKDPRRPVECFGEAAASYIGELLPPGTAVTLARDVSTTDRFGRTLAYVYRDLDGLFVNADMVAKGYAAAATFPPDVTHAGEFVALERRAREAGLGLWSECGGTDVPA